MEQVRGFVIGQDRSKGELRWKVRVKDPSSQFDGRKAVVRSVAEGLRLESGMDVSFSLATVREGEKPLLVALTVTPAVAAGTPQSQARPDGNAPQDDDGGPALVVSSLGGTVTASLFWSVASRQDALREIEASGSDESVIAFSGLNDGRYRKLLNLTEVEELRDALEALLTEVFILGQGTRRQ